MPITPKLMTVRGRSTTGRCDPHGQINKRRTKDEQKTNKRRTKDEQKTNKRRTKDEQKTNKRRTMNKDKEKETSPYSHTELLGTSSLRNVATQRA